MDIKNTIVTQEMWGDILIALWKKNGKLGRAIAVAFCFMPDEIITDDQWTECRDRLVELKVKPFRPTSNARKLIRPMIAEQAPRANNVLWDNQFDLAKKLMTKGGHPLLNPGRAVRNTVRKFTKNTQFLSERALDDRHHWNICK